MGGELIAQCLLFDARPDDVIATIQSLGAESDEERPWVWFYPTVAEPLLRFRLSVALWKDAERLGIGATVAQELLADWMFEDVEAWMRAVATALGMGVAEAAHVIRERSNVILECSYHEALAEGILRRCVATLFAEGDGFVWSGLHGWTAQEVRDDPSCLHFSQWPQQ